MYVEGQGMSEIKERERKKKGKAHELKRGNKERKKRNRGGGKIMI